jgi:hypothetical protein
VVAIRPLCLFASCPASLQCPWRLQCHASRERFAGDQLSSYYTCRTTAPICDKWAVVLAHNVQACLRICSSAAIEGSPFDFAAHHGRAKLLKDGCLRSHPVRCRRWRMGFFRRIFGGGKESGDPLDLLDKSW